MNKRKTEENGQRLKKTKRSSKMKTRTDKVQQLK